MGRRGGGRQEEWRSPRPLTVSDKSLYSLTYRSAVSHTHAAASYRSRAVGLLNTVSQGNTVDSWTGMTVESSGWLTRQPANTQPTHLHTLVRVDESHSGRLQHLVCLGEPIWPVFYTLYGALANWPAAVAGKQSVMHRRVVASTLRGRGRSRWHPPIPHLQIDVQLCVQIQAISDSLVQGKGQVCVHD